MSKAVQRRRGTTAEHSTFTGALGELTVDTTKDTIVVHDGAVAGGYPLLREDGSNSALALGSAGTPSLKWDTNTGIYSPGADQVAISTNGTGRLFVDASGRVGIGNASPQDSLSVTGGGFSFADTGGAARNISWKDLSNNIAPIVIRGEATNGALIFSTNTLGNSGTERMRLDSSGRLGLGTSSPGGQLQVNSPASTVAFMALSATADPQYPSFGFSGQIGSNGGRGTGMYLPVDSALGFSTFGVERLRVDSVGRVGIGTTSPGRLLTVANAANTDATIKDVAYFCGSYAGNAGSGARLLIGGDIASVTNRGVALVGVNTGGAGNAHDMVFEVSSTAAAPIERARIDSSGRLLVGTSSSSGLIRAAFQGNTGNAAGAGVVHLQRGEAAAAITEGEILGELRGTDNADNIGAVVSFTADATWGAGDYPGRLVFSTTADGAASPTERLRITSAGVVQVADASNITVGTTTGTKIGTATTQKLGFYNATPVVQPVAVADATDAASAITQLNALLAHMRTLGLIAT
jgi:hypothetical protein